MPTYFGYNTVGAQQVYLSYTSFATAALNNNGSGLLVCPGSGSQTVKELTCYCYAGAGTPGLTPIRIAVYSNDRSTKICEGAAVDYITDYGAWQGHTTQASITPNPATLTGGVAYVLAVSMYAVASNNYIYYDNTASASDGSGENVDYTGGFPASLGAGTSWAARTSIRCGVDPTGGGFTAVNRRTLGPRVGSRMAA